MQVNSLVDNVREKPLVKKLEKFFPAIAFLGGFGWDSVTLGQKIGDSDLIFLLVYYVVAFVLVILLSAHLDHPEGWTRERVAEAIKGVNREDLSEASSIGNGKISKVAESLSQKVKNAASKVGIETDDVPKNAIVVHHSFLDREWGDKWKSRLSWAVQFCFGSMFSALVVCYFKSSGSISSLILVLLLAFLLVGNEFLQKKYESFGVSLAFFCLLGTMFMNFSIPHLVHRIGFIWFLLSTLVSFCICFFIWKISRYGKKMLVAPIVISVALVAAYIMNWVPPVPLVMKQQIVCQNFERKNFSCDVDKPTFLQTIGVKLPSVHKEEGREVYFLSSVYAPAELRAELEYRWFKRDETSGEYKLVDKVSTGRMQIRGGRESGYRSFTKKKNIPSGRYRVETAYKGGAVIGSSKFEVFENEEAPKGFVRDSLR